MSRINRIRGSGAGRNHLSWPQRPSQNHNSVRNNSIKTFINDLIKHLGVNSRDVLKKIIVGADGMASFRAIHDYITHPDNRLLLETWFGREEIKRLLGILELDLTEKISIK